MYVSESPLFPMNFSHTRLHLRKLTACIVNIINEPIYLLICSF
ncbi:hypothetical protein BSSX_2869 [Bacillus subtilis]|nr:hypothetical protein BSSX_2869 [Bacillus subtilis]